MFFHPTVPTGDLEISIYFVTPALLEKIYFRNGGVKLIVIEINIYISPTLL